MTPELLSWLISAALGILPAISIGIALFWHDEKVRREDLQTEVRHLKRELEKARGSRV